MRATVYERSVYKKCAERTPIFLLTRTTRCGIFFALILAPPIIEGGGVISPRGGERDGK